MMEPNYLLDGRGSQAKPPHGRWVTFNAYLGMAKLFA